MDNNFNTAPLEAPRREGPPSRSAENTQIQWVIESLTQLKTSHGSLENKMLNKFECIETKIEAKHENLNAEVKNNHSLAMSKLETMEIKIHRAIAESRIEAIKWAIGLAVGLPSVAWAFIQIVKIAITK